MQLYPPGWQTFRNVRTPKVGEAVGEHQEPLGTTGKRVLGPTTLERNLAIFKKLKIQEG